MYSLRLDSVEIMRLLGCVIGVFVCVSCSEDNRDPVTLVCDVDSIGTTQPVVQGILHFEDRFLFVKNQSGGADNVCSRIGTIDCTVVKTDRSLSLSQTVEPANCHWRDSTHISFDVDLVSGEFRLDQEGCDPNDDVVFTGTCELR